MIKDDVSVILFDIKIGNWWLKREDVEKIAQQLGVATTPVIGIMILREAEEMVKKGFKSTISDDKRYDAEGLVCNPLVPLCDRAGKRIVGKIKSYDYLYEFQWFNDFMRA